MIKFILFLLFLVIAVLLVWKAVSSKISSGAKQEFSYPAHSGAVMV